MRIRTWGLPAVLTAGQLLLWPGAPLLAGDAVDAAAAATAVVAVLGTGAALLWRRTAPVLALAGVAAGLTLAAWVMPPDQLLLALVADMVALFSVAVHRPRRTALGAAGAVVLWQCGLVPLSGVGGAGEYVASVVTVAALYAFVVAAGRLRRRWHADRAVAARRVTDAEARRREAADAERHRLARELHDVTAHHLTSVVVGVSAAQHVGDKRPELRREALEFAARTGRETLEALHRLVSVMQVPGERAASAGEQLSDLADGFTRLGQRVTLRPGDGEPPAPVAEAVHGIAREALTNTLRYAPGAAVTVRVRHDGRGTELLIDNDAPAPGAVPAGAVAGLGGGRGLAGMRERAAALGGTVEAGPHGAGWRVRAVLPWPAGSAGRPVRRAVRAEHVVDAGVVAGSLVLPAFGLYLVVVDAGAALTGPQYALAGLAVLAQCVPLWWRRRHPWPAAAAVAGASWLWPALVAAGALPPEAGWLVYAGIVADASAAYAAGARGGRPGITWLSVPALALTTAVTGGIVFTVAMRDEPEVVATAQPLLAAAGGALVMAVIVVLLAVPVYLACWGAGAAVGARAARIRAREHGAVARATAWAVAAAADERVRVAAGLRSAVLADTGRVATAAEAGDTDGVLTSARAALTSMRGLLSGLRETAPEPGTAGLEPLAARLRDAGRDVTCTVRGDLGGLPMAVDVSVYRLAEALLDGGAGPAAVIVDRPAGGVRLTVTGVAADPDGVRAAALHARVSALGGTCRPAPDDGVEVFLPVADAEVTSSRSG